MLKLLGARKIVLIALAGVLVGAAAALVPRYIM